jgi:hypothetical protein
MDSQGDVHQFTNTNDGTWHWSGSTGDQSAPLSRGDIPSNVKKLSIRKRVGDGCIRRSKQICVDCGEN